MRVGVAFIAVAFVTVARSAELPSPPTNTRQRPGITAKSAIILDERSGAVLFEKDADTLRYPASTTKVMTTLLLLELTRPETVVVAPADVESVTGASLHLKPGETMSMEHLQYGIMLRSANDGCYTAAVNVAGSVSAFATLMNLRAQQIGCQGTHFANPHGLHDPLHFTTARDLAKIAREAMRNPDFRRLAKTRKMQISRSLNQKDTVVISKNRFLGKDPTTDGIKTGYTRPAGACFVGSATRDGYRIITVILNSEDWKVDQKNMVDWAFRHFTRSVVAPRTQPVGSIPVPLSAGTVDVVIPEDVHYAHRKNEPHGVQVTLLPREGLSAPLRSGDEVGVAVFTDGKGWSVQRPLFASSDVAVAPVAALTGSPNLSGVAMAGVLGFAALAMRRRGSRQWADLKPGDRR